jgi:hypothetical protein
MPLHTKYNTNTEQMQTFMPLVRFEPTIPLLEWAKTFHVLDREAIVITPVFHKTKVMSRLWHENV